MIYKTLTYGRTSTLTDRGDERLEVTIELDETDDPVEALEQVRQFVINELHKIDSPLPAADLPI